MYRFSYVCACDQYISNRKEILPVLCIDHVTITWQKANISRRIQLHLHRMWHFLYHTMIMWQETANFFKSCMHKSSRNCAQSYRAGWWYNDRDRSNLNRPYYNGYIHNWFGFSTHISSVVKWSFVSETNPSNNIILTSSVWTRNLRNTYISLGHEHSVTFCNTEQTYTLVMWLSHDFF